MAAVQRADASGEASEGIAAVPVHGVKQDDVTKWYHCNDSWSFPDPFVLILLPDRGDRSLSDTTYTNKSGIAVRDIGEVLVFYRVYTSPGGITPR